MVPIQIIFIIVTSVTLGAAIMVVTSRNLVHAALWLVLALFGIAVLFVLLEASFLAVSQVVIYIGAISILMIFAIMLTRRIAKDSESQINPNWGWAAVISLVLFAGIFFVLSHWDQFYSPKPPFPGNVDPLTDLGKALVSPNAYVIPFEVASVLLLAALIGAIVIAWDRK